jgi:chemotaxis protein CheX
MAPHGTGFESDKGDITVFLEQEIFEITETTWQAMLGLDIQPGTLPVTIDLADGYWTGKVEISGAWNGVVVLHGSGQLAHSAASAIFTNGHSEVSVQDRMDAMYELTNVIAGNIKSLLPGPCQLSLPQVMQTTLEGLRVTHAELVSDLVFACQEQLLFVSLWRHEKSISDGRIP